MKRRVTLTDLFAMQRILLSYRRRSLFQEDCLLAVRELIHRRTTMNPRLRGKELEEARKTWESLP